MLSIILVFGAGFLSAKWLSRKMPEGFWFSALATLITAAVSLAAGVAVAVIIATVAANIVTPNEAVASGLVHGFLAAILSPFAVWYFRRQRASDKNLR